VDRLAQLEARLAALEEQCQRIERLLLDHIIKCPGTSPEDRPAVEGG
jgi:hypothetical protein